MENKNVDYNKITPELKQKLQQWEAKRPENQQLQVLADIAIMIQELVINTEDNHKSTRDNLKALGAVLTDSREQLVSLNSKEAPESPDYAKPVVDALQKLSKDIDKAVGKIDVKPQVKVPDVKIPEIKVPEVKVPEVNLKPIVETLKKDVSKAFAEAIKLIPKTEVPEAHDYSEQFAAMVSWLESIDTASRLKPTSISAKVTNFPTQNLISGVDYDYLDVQQTDADTETFVFKTGGSGGTTVRTIVVNYTSSAKTDIDNVTWS